jgi:hypothetical protein
MARFHGRAPPPPPPGGGDGVQPRLIGTALKMEIACSTKAMEPIYKIHGVIILLITAMKTKKPITLMLCSLSGSPKSGYFDILKPLFIIALSFYD